MTPQQKLLAALARAAEQREPCPSNVALCRVIGAKSTSTVYRMLGELQADGTITIITGGRNYRVVRIEPMGAHTAPEPAPLRRNQPTRLDELAEHLADGRSLAEAAWRMAITTDYAALIFARICKNLGPQAA